MLKRRQFIQRTSTAAITGFLGLTHCTGVSNKKGSKEDVSSFTFDLHCHPGFFFAKGTDRYPGDEAFIKTVNEMNKGGLSGAFFSTVSDAPIIKITENGVVPARTFDKGEAWSDYKRQLTILKDLLGTVNARIATKLSDLKNDETVAAFISCEGGDFIEGMGRLDEAYADGVRSVQLVHYAPNQLGDLQTEATMHDGLSALGKDTVVKMNELGMVIDVAHASYEMVKKVAAATSSPIILSHSILKAEPNRPIAVRAVTADYAKAVAETGGVIGAWPSGFNSSFDDYIDNILRLVDVVGIDHVGLGTDMDANYKPVFDSYLQLPDWIKALSKKGLSEDEVKRLAGGNMVRVLREVL